MQIAQQQAVDLVLLGGDLFHDNKPSRSTIVRAIDILTQYTLSDKPVAFQVVSDQSVNFVSRWASSTQPAWRLPHAAHASIDQHAQHATHYSGSQIATHCRRVNFENSNFNVGLPVFTIHGNHDDPAGADNLSAVDVLSTCNLVNYFGKAVSILTLLWHPLDQLLCPSMPIAAVQCSSQLQWYTMGCLRVPIWAM